jgi:hypothetical protein
MWGSADLESLPESGHRTIVGHAQSNKSHGKDTLRMATSRVPTIIVSRGMKSLFRRTNEMLSFWLYTFEAVPSMAPAGMWFLSHADQ